MININNKKNLKILIFTLIAIVTLGIGYAGITAINLVINGDATASVNYQNFKVRFLSEDGVTPTITGGDSNSAQVVDDTTAKFSVNTLTAVGDSEVATYKVKNESKGIGADITLNVSSSNSEYFKVTEYIEDTQLRAGEETIVTVTVEMIKTPIENEVSTSITAKLVANAADDDFASGSSSATVYSDDPESFATDSWATIQKAVRNNTTSLYSVGDTKQILIDVDGDGLKESYTVRISNKSISDSCGNESYSETACGFVVEFLSIVTRKKMHDGINTNVGGYPTTDVYNYLTNILYKKLPADLQSVISKTRVISGYGNNGIDNDNFITYDKLFLLSGMEVFGNGYDTASSMTTQLDYYRENNVTIKNHGVFTTKDYQWWLRNAYSNQGAGFACVDSREICYDNYAGNSNGISPAFRIG